MVRNITEYHEKYWNIDATVWAYVQLQADKGPFNLQYYQHVLLIIPEIKSLGWKVVIL